MPAGMTEQTHPGELHRRRSHVDASTAYQQQIYQPASGTFGPGPILLTVQIPKVTTRSTSLRPGDQPVGPATLQRQRLRAGQQQILYSARGGLISADNSGTALQLPSTSYKLTTTATTKTATTATKTAAAPPVVTAATKVASAATIAATMMRSSRRYGQRSDSLTSVRGVRKRNPWCVARTGRRAGHTFPVARFRVQHTISRVTVRFTHPTVYGRSPALRFFTASVLDDGGSCRANARNSSACFVREPSNSSTFSGLAERG